MAQFKTVTDIINQVAAELGHTPSADPLNDGNTVFTQLRYLLQATGEDLLQMHDWQELQEEYTFTTSALDSGIYNLPTNFDHMIDQTGWDRTNQNPVAGSLSPQTWQYLKGSNLMSTALYVTFRIKKNKMAVLPNNPVPDAVTVAFEYIRNTWLLDVDGVTYKSVITAGTDTILFHPTMVTRLLRCKILEAKGFDSEKARDEFSTIFCSVTGRDLPSEILNMAGSGSDGYYIDPYKNTPNTNYGI